MSVDPGAVREIFANMRVMSDRADRAEAAGWVVLVTDLESGKPVMTVGDFDTPEQALVYAGDRERDPHVGTVVDGEPGWGYKVLPRFEPEIVGE